MAYRVCVKCAVPHYENCPGCAGFGVLAGRVERVPIWAGEAIEATQPKPDWIACDICGSDWRGLPLTDLPPPGAERDRLVAEALGYDEPDVAEAPAPYTSRTTHPNGAWHWHHGERRWLAMPYSTSNHAALDALEAFTGAGANGSYEISLNPHYRLGRHRVMVTRYNPEGFGDVFAPTLADAASAAIIEATRREG